MEKAKHESKLIERKPQEIDEVYKINQKGKIKIKYDKLGKIKKNKIAKVNIINIKILRHSKAIIIFIIMSLNLFVQILQDNKIYFLRAYLSKINLKIKGIGFKYIIGPDFDKSNYPNEIYINNNLQNPTNYVYYLNQTDNYVELIWENNINNCRYLFYKCSNITEIDLSEFDSSQVTIIEYMFTDCISLTSINFTNFNTSNVEIMYDMFRNCSSLSSLDLSNFNTNKVKLFVAIFKDCTSLTSLNLSSFETSQATEMYNLFSGCSSLTSLDLTHFETSSVTLMYDMFKGCSSLTSLDLSNFDTSQVLNFNSMFEDCFNLEYINFNNSDIFYFSHYNNLLLNVPNNIVICAQEDSLIFSEINSDNCYIIDCSNDWKLNQKKIIPHSNQCVDICNDNQYEYNGKCVENCINGFFLDDKTNIKICKCELEQCLLCPKVALNKNLCTKCNYNYYTKENDPSNLGEYINCYKEPEGYYLDYNASLYKKCYESCKTCEIKGDNINHNCLSCNPSFSIAINFTNYFNCYQRCNYYYYFDEENNYHCTSSLSCPNNYPKLIEDKLECVKENEINIIQTTEIIKEEYTTEKIGENIYTTKIAIKKTESESIINNKPETERIITNKTININDIIDNMLNIENQTLTKEEENKLYNSVLKTVEESFTNENYDTSKLDSGKDEIIEMSKMTITLTTTQNLKNNLNNNNMTIIDLKECETLLKNFYNISHNESLYMKKIDIKQENMKIPKIDYAVYYKLYGTNLIRLNLSICDNSTISLSVPVEIDGDLNKLNSSSGYFNDKCYSSTSNSGTDITLKDRKTDFVEGNKTVCQENCAFSEYDKDNKIANCSCQVKESNTSFQDMNIDKNKLYENFGEGSNSNSMSNLGITSCNVLGKSENIESNAGFYSLLIILAVFVVVFIIFCTKGYSLLENKFDEVIYNRFEKGNKKKRKKIKKTILNELHHPTKKVPKSKIKKVPQKHLIKKPKELQNIHIDENGGIKQIKTNIDNDKSQTETLDIKPDTDYEFNWLSYDEATKFDKRSNCEYYGSLIRSKQLFIFTFCSFNDYNSGVIKKFMFFLSFALHYTVNALFFNDSNIHQIYEDEGQYNVGYQMPFIISSAVIATVALRLMLQFLILTDKDVLEVKLQKTKVDAVNLKEKKLKCLKIKFAIFFILNFILLGLFWYYLTCFNAIYKNTQIYLIENTFISFAFSLFYPFIINIIPTVMRMNSIHSANKDKQCLYKSSQIVQLI